MAGLKLTPFNDKFIEALTLAFLQNKPIENIEKYAARGRYLRDASTEVLLHLWVDRFKAYATDLSALAPRSDAEDIEAELSFRGVDVPFDRVQPELALIKAAAKEAYDAAMADPVRKKQMEDGLANDLAEFHTKNLISPKS